MSSSTTVQGTSAPKKLSWLNIIGYGMGDASNNVGWQMMNMFLTTYYIYMGINPAVVAAIFLGARLFQAVVYLFAGNVTDSFQPNKNGKFRRLVVIFGLPLMVSVTLMYTIPSGSSMTIKIWWAIITYLLYQLFGALGGVPYGALLGAMSQDANERQKLSSSRMFASAAVGVIFTFTLATRVNSMDPSKLFLPVVSVFCVLGALGYLFLYKTTFEQFTVQPEAKVSTLHSLKVMVRNKALFLVCLGALFMTNPVSSIAPIVAKEALTVGQPQLTTQITFALTLVSVLAGVIVTPFSPLIVRKLGKKTTWILGCAIVIVSSLCFIFVGNAWLAVLFIAFNSIGVQIINPCVWAMQADSVQYYEYTTGVKNTEGAAMAALSFSRQVGGAINSWAGPAILGFIGYQSGMNVAQDASVQTSMRWSVGLVPSVIFAISAIFIFFYPITEKKFKEITETLKQRHAEEAGRS
ncbi:MAG: glycoside-pentoside-hexuronide (GPH):cation symporter [Bifidobacterium psychraerophilum]|jgi:glucuronide carrier protein|uniref:MFS transporter n=1 Tax=Bifidobacterium psychraerophilum TaxID=218140 RepID=UPI0039E76251